MRILKLILKGYKPLVINNVNEFIYDPTSPYQLILGTNGSGKSSLLRELGPMPGVAGDYIKGGYKEIHIEHRGHVYKLTSTFKSGNKHTFIKGDEVLNNEGTGAVQKELVKREFGITQDFQDLLTGLVKFTDMTPLKRRDWLTLLCETDFTYAIGAHQTLKSKLRDAQGALKHVQQRITGESNKLLAFTDGEAVEQRFQQLHDELDVLFQNRDPHTQPVSDLEQRIQRSLERAERLSQQVVEASLINRPAGVEYQSLTEVEDAIQQLQTDLKVQVSLRERISQELQELEKLVEGIRANGADDIEGLQKRLESLRKTLEDERGSIEQFTIDYAPNDALNAFWQANDSLMEILHSLPDNSDRRFNKDSLGNAQTQRREIHQQLEKLANQRARVESQIEHIHQSPETQCPQCNYRWTPGVSEHELARAKETQGKIQARQDQLQQELQQLGEFIETSEDYAHRYRSLRQLHAQYPLLKPLWDYLVENKAFTHTPSRWIPTLYTFERDAKRWVEIERHQRTCEELVALIDGSGKQGDTQGFTNRLQTLHRQAEDVTEAIVTLEGRLYAMQEYRRRLAGLYNLYQQLEQVVDTLSQDRDALINAYRSDTINGAIRDHQIEMAELQRKRNERQTIEGVLSDLEHSKTTLEDDQVVLDALVKALSPTDGLIAEQLTGFIEGFVAHLNQLIEGIWTYDLHIRPCGLAEGELDYRFPLEIKGESSLVPDISKGSTAQVEVVNLAFKLVAMVYLNLEDYPLYLDEVGASFDEQHRVNVMNVLKRLVDTGNYTQMFLISHYAGQYGSFPQAETLVMDSANIVVPGEYNQHVVMQ